MIAGSRGLLAQARGGDVAALERLMEEYSGRVFRLADGITRNHADAEEIVQDVFVTILNKGDTFVGRSALSTWIYRVTANAALNKRRGKRRELEVSIDEHLPTFQPDGHRSGERAYLLADWSQDPERATLAGETRRVLERSLDALPPHYRAILVLRDVEDLSNEHVAEVIGESVASVKSRLHRARMALREQLTRHLTHDDVTKSAEATSAFRHSSRS
jgi:RNA polymerase sigma-70 factor, ECF subfamily